MGLSDKMGATPMSSREGRRAPDEARRFIAELDRALDKTALRAAEVGADDTLRRITAAKAATKRGAVCLDKLQATISSRQNDGPPSDHGKNLLN